MKNIGILAYATKSKGIGGTIKELPEDFMVQEIQEDRSTSSFEPSKELPKSSEEVKEYTHFTLVKRDWNQEQILKRVARRLEISRKRFSTSGTKDKKALTAQKVSAWKISPKELLNVRIKDCELGDFSYSSEKIELGDHWGNRFTVKLLGASGSPEKTLKELEEFGGIPNFFGEQRFGLRLNNHIVGKHILEGNIESAVHEFLAGTGERESEEGRKARETLAENWGDFGKALKEFPVYMRFERALLDHLNIHPNDYVGAFKKLSKQTYKFFTHAYQSYLFNIILSERINNGSNLDGSSNILGYESEPDEAESTLLEKEGLNLKDFKVSQFPEASVRGDIRTHLAEIGNLSWEDEKDINLGFDLRKGAYATILLREVQKA
ncbi:MAG: tRNA pseudouridine(13) synthase TruD [Euryarchaeota archaeon]|jgi:tRNA pseudouridine13 synthase|nr:tRNA pseudouridine(13) synthase TruD [Euryarchaeota archaeon]|tara:strand:+ start:12207 stop:13343 length:1137 start_codon:yes stop_codon:yes gene_type:complete